ncbi:MAG: substrate-binding domain-containing protein, partial [Acidobacteriota bacterium]
MRAIRAETRGALCAFGLLALACAQQPADTTAGDGRHDSSPSALAGKLVLTGSSTVAPLASEIGKRFETLHPQTRIDVQMGGSSRGIADARQGLADIGLVSRALHADESDLHAFTIARD